MPEYEVKWIIEVDADSPMEAAELALEIQRDVDAQATVFHVNEKDSPVVSIIDLHNDK